MLVFLRALSECFALLILHSPLAILSIPRASHGNGFQIYFSSLTSCLSSRPVCLAVKCSSVLGYPTGNSNSICSKLNLPSLPVFPTVNDPVDYPEIWKTSPSTSPQCPINYQFYQFSHRIAIESVHCLSQSTATN